MYTARPPTRGAVAAGDERTADAAVHALRAGGNAVDAAIAGCLAAGVAEPLMIGLGGGAVALVRDGRDGAVRAFDFMGAIPGLERPPGPPPPMAAANVDYGVEQQTFHGGPGSVGVPGVGAGLEVLHRRYGSLPMEVLAEPAVAFARGGIEVRDNLRVALGLVEALIRMGEQPSARLLPGGARIAAGATLRQPALADTLEQFARDGAAALYGGPLGEALLAFAGPPDGQLTPADLAAYRVHRRPPLVRAYRGARLHTNPPPGAGGVLLSFALGVLERCGPAPITVDADVLLRLARVMACADAIRDGGFHRGLDDPAYVAARLADEALAEGAASIAAAGLGADAPADNPVGSTTHISTADEHGTLVALTGSNGENCGFDLPGSGVLLNNFLGEEDLWDPAGGAPAPGSRVRTMMAPSLLELADGRWVALGSGGANRIRSALLQGIVQIVDRGAPLAEAVAHPRIHHEGGLCRAEDDGFAPGVLDTLERTLGPLSRYPARHMYFGGLHAVAVAPDGTFDGAGDERRGGVFRCC